MAKKREKQFYLAIPHLAIYIGYHGINHDEIKVLFLSCNRAGSVCS
jgi:hypothetical protein